MGKGDERTAIEQIESMRNLLAFLLVGAFITMLPFLLFKNIPSANEQILTYMIGQLSGMATLALGFYFVNKVGQDALDAKRSDSTGKLAEAVTTALNSAPSVDANALKAGDTVTLDKEDTDANSLRDPGAA